MSCLSHGNVTYAGFLMSRLQSIDGPRILEWFDPEQGGRLISADLLI